MIFRENNPTAKTIVKNFVEKNCDGKLVIVLCGGSKPEVAKKPYQKW